MLCLASRSGKVPVLITGSNLSMGDTDFGGGPLGLRSNGVTE